MSSSTAQPCNVRLKAISNVASLAVLGLVVTSLLLALFVIRPIVVAPRQRLVRLLCETDYRALLEGCRELSSRVRRGDLKAGRYPVRFDPRQENASIPQVILNVQPNHVTIEDDGRVIVEMLGAPSYGVVAYPEDYRLGHQGKVELIPGLWYYDENYGMYADRKKDIDALIEQGKRRNNLAH